MAIFHLDVKTGTRGGGQSASAKYDYLGREGRYAKDAAELEYKESGNLPQWAEDDPRSYWEAADEHERSNGRLFQQVEVALPVELAERQRRDLAGSFAERLTREERLPYTLAIHRGGEGWGESPCAPDNLVSVPTTAWSGARSSGSSGQTGSIRSEAGPRRAGR